MSWITNYLSKPTFESQPFKFFAFISCFITRTPIVWPCIKITNNYVYNTGYDLRYNLIANSKFDKNVSNSSDDWLGER